MGPSFEVQVLDFNDETQKVKLTVLTAWKFALNIEANTGVAVMNPPCGEIVRKFLSAPSDYPIDALALHIQTSLADIQKQLGIAA
jgi:hypothetical protein